MISQLLDLLLGLGFVFLLFSSLSSALVELLELHFRRRAVLLEHGLRELLGSVCKSADRSEQRTADLVAAFYDSPHISSLYRGEYPKCAGTAVKAGAAPVARPGVDQLKHLPSYIPSERFAGALAYLAQDSSIDEALRQRFMQLCLQILSVVGLPADAGAKQQMAAVCGYFNDSMHRVSGWYRRWTSLWLLLVGLVIATAFNVDTLDLIGTLSQNPELRRQLIERALSLDDSGLEDESAVPCVDGSGCLDGLRKRVADQLELAESMGLPIAWTQARWQLLWTPPQPAALSADCGLRCRSGKCLAAAWQGLHPGTLLYKLLGVILTAIAISLGAPFWFQLLNRIVELRSTLKPRQPEDASTSDSAAAATTSPLAAAASRR